MTTVDLIAQEMKRRGLRLWSFPGGTVYSLYHACHQAGVEVVVARSEAGAGYMAIGAAKATGKPQVCAVTSGPGVTNVLTCVADAYYDSVPVVFLTGQVSTKYLRGREGVRQRGFQETPTTRLAWPIALSAYNNPSAFIMALGETVLGRPGPVVIDMPMDLQKEDALMWCELEPFRISLVQEDIEMAADALEKAKRPLVLAGAGAMGAYQQVRQLVALGYPVVTSLPAVGIIPSNAPQHLGYIGHTGFPTANRAITECDMLLVLGARLDMRQTGTEPFAPQVHIIRVDIDDAELRQSAVKHDGIWADCGKFLDALIPGLSEKEQWAQRQMTLPGSQMGDAILQISEGAPEECIFTTGVGTHQQEAARHLHLDYPRRILLTSSGHGCMGAGLPMAIGATISTGKPAIVVDGDGSFQMTMAELGTIADRNLPVEVNIMSNGAGGIVSQFARSQGYEPRETTWSTPDFEKIGEAYGVAVNVWETEQEGIWPILETQHRMDDMTW